MLVEAHQPCADCGSSDALSVYDDHTYCFSCGTWKGLNGVEKKGEFVYGESIGDESWTPRELYPITSKIRGISPKRFEQYSYGRDESGNHIINHYDSSGNLVSQKIRYKDKTFSWLGHAKKSGLFGLHLWRSGGKQITITEGELDCLSVAEALDGRYPVISVNNGAQSAKRDLAKHIEFLNSYDKILLWFDDDEAGRKATAEVATLFPAGKVYVVSKTGYKDANEVLKNKGKAGVLQAYYENKLFTPAGIVVGSQLSFEDVISIDTSKSYTTPYTGLDEKLRGLRKGELVTFTAGSGMGKTTMVREIAYHFMTSHNLKIGWVALEENTQRSALGFMSLHLNKPVYLTEERKETPKEALEKAYKEVIATDKLYFFDHWGSLDSDVLINKLRFLAVACDVDFIFLDHISIVVSAGVQDNERIAIDNLMTNLRSLAEETGIGIVIVSHLRRPSGEKGFENGHEVTLGHLRGSGGIAQLSDGVVALERDQQAEKDSNKGTIRILKNRYTGEVGKAGQVVYHKEFGRLLYLDEPVEFRDESDEQEAEF